MPRIIRKPRSRIRRFRRIFDQCQFCRNGTAPSYKDPETLLKYLRDTGKISPRRINANCARHQRRLARAVKRARYLALLPFELRVK